ncbi:TonB-dependent receptor [Sphingopyxis sp. C-1]|uniref:TonB-dependent receptor n=1 Tax=Sphingopyxis sp. C-1 TaxID=262667 RepID=UPI0006C6F292|nr:TonB-dependent receptor [Sphingopyxis sp. C-1]GAO80940.1 outer membrane receptor proteins, mostly Fe transport [Sphingopyxis sp. C-1]
MAKIFALKSATSIAAALLASAALVTPAYAQDAAALDATGDDENAINASTIVVTANRRAEVISEVPIAISAITAEEFERRNALSLDDLQAAVPGLRLVDIGPGSQRIQLRGVSQYLGQATVGNYIDEFSVTNLGAQGVAEVQLLDLERVEVLRGPQPALYGESSMGGTIRYITARPDLDEFMGSVTGEVSTIKSGEEAYRAEGFVNVPIAPGVAALRISAQHREMGGWIDSPTADDYNDRQITTIRGKLLVEPSPQFSVTATVLYNESKQDSVSFSLDGLNTAQTSLTPSSQEYLLGYLEASYDFGAVELLSVTGYIDQNSFARRDIAPFFNTVFGFPAFGQVFSDADGSFERFSQELRLTSDSSGSFRYLIGGIYAEGTGEGVATSTYRPAPIPAFGIFDDRFDSRTRSETIAVYGNLELDLADWLTIEAGGRYFREKLEQSSVTTLIGAGGPGNNVVTTRGDDATFDTFNPRVSITANFDGSIIYASAAKGFRSGGFNLAPQAPNPTFDPESLWTYEAGTKLSFLDGAAYVEAAIYYQDYTGIQSTNITPLGATAVFNSGAADGFGFDLALVLTPSDTFQFSASMGHNDVNFTTNAVDKFAGDPLDLVPPYNISVAADWTPRVSDSFDLRVHADLNYIDEAAIILRQVGALGFDTVAPNESRVLVNSRIGVDFGAFEVYAFGTNLFNELKEVNPDFGAFVEPIFTQPRTLGLGVRANF